MGADRVHLFQLSMLKPLIGSMTLAAVGVCPPGKLATATNQTSVFPGASICQHTGCLISIPSFILYPQIAYLCTHSCNLCLLSPYEVSAFWSGKSSPHCICANTTQRSELTCPEARSAIPARYWGFRVKKTDKVSALREFTCLPFKNPQVR